MIENKKCTNKRYMLSFSLATNQAGNKTVEKALKDFINSKDWCTKEIKVSNFDLPIKL